MDENMETAGGGEGADSGKSQSGNNRILMIGVLAGVILVNSLIAFGLIRLTKPQSEEQKVAHLKADSLKQALERATTMGATTFEKPIEAIVNIAGTGGDRFLKATIFFEYDDAEYPDLGEELVRRTPKFKDLLINHLSRLTLAELTEADAKDKIRKDLLKLVNATLPPKSGEVREVMFSSFIIQ